jgi:heme O synthase-like polyprenyltransferase
MSDDSPTPREIPVLPPTKNSTETTELWTSLATFLMTVVVTLTGTVKGSGSVIATIFSLVVMAGTYAFMNTPLAAKRVGWKTPMFWSSVMTIVGSIALAFTEADIPGLPPGVTKISSIVAAGVAASGYNVYRYTHKTS